MSISIDTRYWFETGVARAWPPGQDRFTGENNPKANYALDLNIDGQVLTFIPESVINKGVHADWKDIRVAEQYFTLPWFLNPENQAKLAEVGAKTDLKNTDVGNYLKDKMGASTSGFLIPKGSLPFDSVINGSPLETQGMGQINGQPVYLQKNPNTGVGSERTLFVDSSGTERMYVPSSGGGFFEDLFGGIGDLLKNPFEAVSDLYMEVRDPLQAAAVVAGNYVLPGSSLVTSQLVSEGAKEKLATDELRLANLAAGIAGSMPTADPNAVGGVTGPDNIDVGGGFNPAGAPITAEEIAQQIASPAAEQVAAEQAAIQQAIAEQSAPITAETITSQIAPEVNLGTATAGDIAMAVDPVAANIATGMSAEAAAALAAEQVAADLASQEAARIAAENAAMDAALQDLANSASPVFATSAAAQGLTLKQGLDAVRAGLLINAITGDPLGLNDVVGKGGNTFANQGFAQVPIPEGWKSPEYTYTPVQNVSFEDLFPGVSLQGTQWQNMPQAQTFNQLFAAGQQQTPMGTPVDLNQIVGSILGQSTTG